MASPDTLDPHFDAPPSLASHASLTPPTPLTDHCYPHLVEWILKLVTDYDTKLSIRATSRRFKQKIDSKLFHHVALVALPFEKPMSRPSLRSQTRWMIALIMRQPYTPFRYLPWLPEHLGSVTGSDEISMSLRYDWPEEFSSPMSSSLWLPPNTSSRWPCPEVLDYYGVAPHYAAVNDSGARESVPGLKVLRDGSAEPYFNKAINVSCLVTQSPPLYIKNIFPWLFNHPYVNYGWSTAITQVAHCRWSYQRRRNWRMIKWELEGSGSFNSATLIYVIPPPPSYWKQGAKNSVIKALRRSVSRNFRGPHLAQVLLVGLENLESAEKHEDEQDNEAALAMAFNTHLEASASEGDYGLHTDDSADSDQPQTQTATSGATCSRREVSSVSDDQVYHKLAEEIVDALSFHGRKPLYMTFPEWQATLEVDPVVLERELPMPGSVWGKSRVGCKAHDL